MSSTHLLVFLIGLCIGGTIMGIISICLILPLERRLRSLEDGKE